VSEQQALIWKKLDHLGRMRAYLLYSLAQIEKLLLVQDWTGLQPDQHESMAAFRVRFSEFQEHMGKTMKAIAIEEEKPSEPFTAVLLYMEKLGCLDSVSQSQQIFHIKNSFCKLSRSCQGCG
jgi:hypothetical protein